MVRFWQIPSIILFILLSANVHAGEGVPLGGFPNWSERMLHVLVNRARSDPAADLAACPNCADAACYTPQLPLAWNLNLAHAARFHATSLTSSECSITHNSPCELVSDIGTTYPDTCDGTVGCACAGPIDCTGGTFTGDRLFAFGISGSWGENMATLADPFTIFYLWLWESTANEVCTWTIENGHRYNILNGTYTHVGSGADGGFMVQDFWRTTAGSYKIPSGAHYPQSGTNIAFRANWNDGEAPQKAQVIINGSAFGMSVERGSGGNATYLYESTLETACSPYYFKFTDSAGDLHFYPEEGSFGVNCAYDWSAGRLESRNASFIPALLLLLRD